MITTGDTHLADRLRLLRSHGVTVSPYERHGADRIIEERFVEMGFNFRMSDVAAAMGLVQLAKLDTMIERRRHLAACYAGALAGVPGLTLPTDPDYGETTFQSYSVLLGDEYPLPRDELMAALRERGVTTKPGVMAAHREPAFAGVAHGPLPVTEHLADRSIILPLFHEMTEAQIERVAALIREPGA
jgi:perosamine synthetase